MEQQALDDGGQLGRIYEQFEPDDPRRGPFSDEQRAEAAAYAEVKGRWHVRRRNVDWFAVQLQYGRGLSAQRVGRMFSISDSTIGTRRDVGKWVSPMSEADRRDLARLVWLAGEARIATDDAASLAALKGASEWRLAQDTAPVTWQAKDKAGAPMTLTLNDEIPHDVYYSAADPQRADRIEMRSKLTDLIERMHGTSRRERRIQMATWLRNWLTTRDALETPRRADRVWLAWANDPQLPPEDDWRIWMMMGGRGAGKTRAGAEWVRQLVDSGRVRRLALVGPTLHDVREVMIEGPSGLKSIADTGCVPVYEVTRRRLLWPCGAEAMCSRRRIRIRCAARNSRRHGATRSGLGRATRAPGTR